MTAEPKYLSGFVTIIGSPNVGKSTLMNRFVGQKVSIVSQRAQTTRNRIMGVVSRRRFIQSFPLAARRKLLLHRGETPDVLLKGVPNVIQPNQSDQ